jgi:hypothetical protein
MNKLLTVVVLMGSFTAIQALAQTTDYIDVKPVCERLEASVVEQCQDSSHKVNHTHALNMIRINDKTQQVIEAESKISESNLVQVCEEFKTKKFDNKDEKAIPFEVPLKNETKWKIVFTFGPFLSFHKKLDMRLQNADTDVMISGLEPVQRTGLHHYAVWSDNTKIGKFIDEPQNDFTIELNNVNNGLFFGLRYSHPKTLFQDRHDNPQINHNVDIVGTIGGRVVDKHGVDLKDDIHTLTTSHGNTNINAFGGKAFNLAGKKGGNNLELRMGAGAGVSFANGVSKYFALDENGVNKLKIKEFSGMKVYGFNLTGETTLRYNFMQGRMNASINGRGVYTRIDGPIGDFHATGNLYSGQVGAALGYSPNLILTASEKAQKKIAKMEREERKAEKLENN